MRLPDALELRRRLVARTGEQYVVLRGPRTTSVSPFYVRRVRRLPTPSRPRRTRSMDAEGNLARARNRQLDLLSYGPESQR